MQLRAEQIGEIAILTIDRPSRRNSLGLQLIEELTAELDRADRDPATRVIVLTGSAPGFCAGSDLKELAGMDLAGMGAHEARTAALARSIALMNKPVVAGIEGFALGGGFVLAVSCDVVVSELSTRWHLPEVTIGWIPPWGIQALVARVGPVTARRLGLGLRSVRRSGGSSAGNCGLSGRARRNGARRCTSRGNTAGGTAGPSCRVNEAILRATRLRSGREFGCVGQSSLPRRLRSSCREGNPQPLWSSRVSKRISADDAARLVRSGDTVASVGVIGWVTPDALLRGLADRFRRDSEPRDLTFYFPCGTGDSIDIRGMDHVAIEGLMRRIISGSYVNPLHPTKRTRPELMRLIRENRIEAYSWPIGASMQWLREVARRSPGLMTEIGLGTYADPRQQGGKFTSLAKQDLIELIEFRGKPYLFYPTFPLNVGFIRASSADSSGNLSYEDETLISSNIALALAVKASGGIVIAQVRQEVARYSRPAHHVRIPGVLVDHYVVEPEQMSGTDIRSDRAYLGGAAPDLDSLPKLPLGTDKVIARRASREVRPGRTCIFGFGASSDVPLVMAEAGLFDDGRIGDYQFTTEHGPFRRHRHERLAILRQYRT